jgi:hypothetical protein
MPSVVRRVNLTLHRRIDDALQAAPMPPQQTGGRRQRTARANHGHRKRLKVQRETRARLGPWHLHGLHSVLLAPAARRRTTQFHTILHHAQMPPTSFLHVVVNRRLFPALRTTRPPPSGHRSHTVTRCSGRLSSPFVTSHGGGSCSNLA